jgi:malate dehydrogenase
MCAMYLAEANLADIVLIDIIEGVPQGKAMDLTQAGPVRGYNSMVRGSNDMKDIKDAAIVVMTAGVPRKPGMSREDLLTTNANITASAGNYIKKYAPNSFVIMVSNPLDLMTYHMQKITGFPTNRVLGQAGVLDSSRFRWLVALELNVAMSEVHAMILGGHGDTMVPLPRYTSVAGVPVTELISKERLKAISDRTREGGGEIVKLLKTGSAYYAPAAATVDKCLSILYDEKRLIPASAYLTGQYGLKDIYIGVPIVLGANGVERILELKLNKTEMSALQVSANTYKEHLKLLGY